MTRICTATLGFALLCSLLCSSARAERLHVAGRFLLDERGGTVTLRGLNIGGDSKVPPFRAIDDASQLDVLADWGVNVVRLLFAWEAFEPERDRFDETYWGYYLATVDALHERGVHVIVDFHQDGFSRYATGGCGDGLPRWALGGCAKPLPPDNGPLCASWGIMAVLDPITAGCFRDFYADKVGVRTSYLNMLSNVAERLADHEAILGYDMLNEPSGDEASEIATLYEDAAKALREQDPDAVLFVSPGMLTSAGQQTELPKPHFDNFVYAPHYYDAAVSQLATWLGTDLSEPFATMSQKAYEWNVPLFLGEFGAPAEGIRSDAYIDEFYAQLDRHLASGAQWNFTPHWTPAEKDGWNGEDFSIVDDRGELRATYRIRPYPARTAGAPMSFSVTGHSGDPHVTLAWEHDPDLGETVIFAPAALFHDNPLVETSEGTQCSYTSDARQLRCTADTRGRKEAHISRCGAQNPCRL